MKILFYTRLEGNTGGDETFLNTLKFYLVEQLTEGIEANLCLSYDELSEGRARKIADAWNRTLKEKNLTGQVFLFLTDGRNLEKSILPVKCRYINLGTKTIEKNRTLDTLNEALTWYIKSPEGYSVRVKKKNSLLPIKGDQEGVFLCYAALHASKQGVNYPLFVIDVDKTLYYYKDSVSLAQEYSLLTGSPKVLPGLVSRIGKSKSQLVVLDEAELKAITTFTSYIPEELLITDAEYQTIDQNLEIPGSLVYERARWLAFKRLTSSLDLFVMAGWAHLQSRVTAEYLKTELELPLDCKVLLSSVPGMSVNVFGFVTGLKEEPSYQNLHVLQPGIGTTGGFPLLPTLKKAGIERQQVREEWMAHVSECKQYMSETGETRQDKLIVIYCSKDAPGLSGIGFLQSISEQVNVRDYHVLLIGANPDSYECNLWVKQCILRDLTYTLSPRTASTEVLMRGLRDAEFSMATGSYSILEARYLDIAHCVYLCPPHMKQLGDMLEKAPREGIEQAFKQGQIALNELMELLSPEYRGELFNSNLAWKLDDSSEWKLSWQQYLEDSQQLDVSSSVQTMSNAM